ncbi:ATP-binding protein [Cohnella boryungensis]|uniref:histidine kinase n=1 Tax=Cohnella boryungensis TaxID=768479 RepID=A0ABV8SI68_9BACL
MTIKAKLSLLISVVVTAVLALNISIYYYSTKNELEMSRRQEMQTIAMQIGTSLDAAAKSKSFMEEAIGERLRMAALAAQSQLDPHIDRIRNEQLIELSARLGVDHISLWQRTEDDIKVLKSSDPKELDMGSKTMDYWYTAFNQLLDAREVRIPQGQKLSNYWSGPYQYASSDPDRVNKWGYYYDGTTNYIINPYVNAQALLDYEKQIGTESLIRKLMEDNGEILEITGFNPAFFGKAPILKQKKGKTVHNLDVQGVVFGPYTFSEERSDAERVRQAAQTGQIVTAKQRLQDRDILKSFVALSGESPYVVGVVFSYDAVRAALNHQLLLHISISLLLIVVAYIVSYFMAGWLIRPLRLILDNVNEIAEGRFGSKITVRGRDELGWLSSRVNAMADNLQLYTDKLRDSAEELRNTKEYLESFVNHTSDAIHVTNLQGRVRQANQAYEAMYGWSLEETLHTEPRIVPKEMEEEYADIRRRVQAGQSMADYETVRLCKDGTLIDVSITVSPIRDEGGEIVAIAEISRNITARKQSEEAIRRSEKLSVIGQLAAGVAHEIRNPLTTLRGFVQLGHRQGTLSTSYLEIMLSELDRINLIVGEFLVLAKPQGGRRELADMATLLREMIALLESQAVMMNVTFVPRFRQSVPPVKCDANQLKQVMINVIRNGMEAMQEKGGDLELELQLEGEDVVVRITDQGRGVAEEDLSKLGEPFFTSKPSGNGLGLMVSKRIIASHHGTLSITSKLGEGTCVEIKLPLPAVSQD